MKNSLQLLKILFILILLPVLFQGCAKKYDNAFNDLPLTIDSIVPSSGNAGTPVRIYGQGFAYPAADNKVFFNGVQATVDSNTVLGVLLAYAPAKGTTGNLSVEAVPYHDSARGPVFTYPIIPAPVITDVEYNGPFVILGEHFDPTASIVAIAGQVVSGFSYADYGNGTAALTKASYTPPLALDNPVQVTVTVNGVSSAPYTYLFYPRVSLVSPDTVYYNATVTLQGTLFGNRSVTSSVKAYYYDAGQNKIYMSPDPAVVSWNTNTIKITEPNYGSYPIGSGAQPFYFEVNVESKSGAAPVYFHSL